MYYEGFIFENLRHRAKIHALLSSIIYANAHFW